MANWNLDSFNNFHSSIAESSYTGRPNSFAKKELEEEAKKKLSDGQSVLFDYSADVKKMIKSPKAEEQIYLMVARFIFNQIIKSY